MPNEVIPSAAPVVETPVEQNDTGTAQPVAVAPAVVPAPSSKKKFKLKVDGQEFEEEVDLADEDYLRSQLQFSKVAQKRMSEKATLEKEVQSFIDLLRKDPKAILSDPSLGLDLKQFAASIIEEDIRNSQKSPEQLEKEKLEAELKALKEQAERDKEESRQKEFNQIQEREFERYENLMMQTLEKSDLPNSPYVVKKMAEYMLIGVKNGMPLTPDDVLPLVREEVLNDLKAMFKIWPEETIEKLLGKDIISKIRKKSIAKGKVPPKPLSSAITPTGQKSTKEEVEQPRKTLKELLGI